METPLLEALSNELIRFEVLSFVSTGTSFLAFSSPDSASLGSTNRALRDATTLEWPGFSYLLSVELLAWPGSDRRMRRGSSDNLLRLESVQEHQHLASFSYSTLRKATWAAMGLRAQFDRWFVWDLCEECKEIGELTAVWTGYSSADPDLHDDQSMLKITLSRSRCDPPPSSIVAAIKASVAWEKVVDEREGRCELDGVAMPADTPLDVDGERLAWSATPLPLHSVTLTRHASTSTLGTRTMSG